MSRVAKGTAPADRRKLILYVTVAVVVIAAVVGVSLASRVPKAATNAGQAPASIKVGDTAPAFAVQTNAGPFDLSQVSTPVLLEAFATWCPHCQRETGVLNAAATRYAGKLAIVAVSASPYGLDGSQPETQADVNQFGARFGVRYPLAYDPTLEVARKYMQSGYPTIVLIGADKKIRWIKDGEVPPAVLDKAIDGVLKGS